MIRTPEHEVVQFDGPVLELMTEARTRFDQRIAGLGPDLLADDFDERRFLSRLRGDDRTRPFGDALLDQRNAVGNRQHLEVGGVLPCRASIPGGGWSDVTNDEALAAVRAIRPLMRASAERRGYARAPAGSIDRAGLPCRRCGTLIQRAATATTTARPTGAAGCQS